MHTTNFQDTAQLFANAIALFLRTDEEYRAAWRYKHRQEALKTPRREALKNAIAWADIVGDYLQMQESRNPFENHVGKMWEAWESFRIVRDNYLGDREAKSLALLKDAEKALKTCIRSVNALLQ